jgi:hypothetical protein
MQHPVIKMLDALRAASRHDYFSILHCRQPHRIEKPSASKRELTSTLSDEAVSIHQPLFELTPLFLLPSFYSTISLTAQFISFPRHFCLNRILRFSLNIS